MVHKVNTNVLNRFNVYCLYLGSESDGKCRCGNNLFSALNTNIANTCSGTAADSMFVCGSETTSSGDRKACDENSLNPRCFNDAATPMVAIGDEKSTCQVIIYTDFSYLDCKN